MFKSLRSVEQTKLNHSGRSYIGETMQLEGDLRTSGSIDVAGLINGNIFVSEMTVAETGSIRGSVEATAVEINGHIAGKNFSRYSDSWKNSSSQRRYIF